MDQKFQSIVVLTGAGISAESGIKTFRASDGLWEEHRVEDVATPEAFDRDPVLVHRFYNARRKHLLSGIQPNAAHQALAEFEKRFAGSFTLVSQNIDDLHARAGSQNLLPLHGQLLKMRCVKTGQRFSCPNELSIEDMCQCCGEPGTLRPDIVWFGEMPLHMDAIDQALRDCDLFVSIGTSGNVYPAAGFVQQAKAYGAHTVELNLEPSALGSIFDEQHYGPATEKVPAYFESLSDAC